MQKTVREKCKRVEKDHDEKRGERYYDDESEEKWRKELEKLGTELDKWRKERRWELDYHEKMKQAEV